MSEVVIRRAQYRLGTRGPTQEAVGHTEHEELDHLRLVCDKSRGVASAVSGVGEIDLGGHLHGREKDHADRGSR